MIQLTKAFYSRIALILLVGLLLVYFQNCSSPNVSFSPSNVLSNVVSDNNGSGYDGKPQGNFYRYHPEFSCEGKETFVSLIKSTSESITLLENKQLHCGTVEQPLSPTLVDSSVFQKQIIGYKEGIFESHETVPNQIPANLVEVWCRDSNDYSGIETITYFNRITLEAVTRVYYSADSGTGGNTVQLINDFPVARVVSANQIEIRDEKGFKVVVYRDQPASQLGLFQADLNIVIDKKEVSRRTSCRLGGTIDPKLWPLKQIVDLNIKKIEMSPDKTAFAYSAPVDSSRIQHLFYTSQVDNSHRRLTPLSLTAGVLNFHFPKTRSDSLVYYGDTRVSSIRELFKVSVDGSSLVQLGAQLVSPNHSSPYGRLQFSNDGSRVFYEDGSHEALGQDVETWIRSIPLNGGTPIVINPPITLPDVGSLDYVVSEKNRVAFLMGFTSGTLYLADLDGENQIKPMDAHIPSDWYIRFREKLILSESQDYVHFVTYKITTMNFRYNVVAMDGSLVRSLPLNQRLIANSPSGENVLLAADKDIYSVKPYKVVRNSKIVNVITGAEKPIPEIADQFFSKDSSSLIGISPQTNGTWEPILVSLIDDQTSSLCPEAIGSYVSVVEFQQDEFLILSNNKQAGVATVYTKSGASACIKRNSFPTQEIIKSDVTISKDFSKALLKVTVSNSNGTTSMKAIYLPMDGKPSIVINSPVFTNATISDLIFTYDEKAVLLFGDQTVPSEINSFIWNLP